MVVSTQGLIEELKHSLLYTTLELETTIFTAREEITKREVEIIQLKEALNKTIKERNDAQVKYQQLLLENHLLKKPESASASATPATGISGSSSDDESKSSDTTQTKATLSPPISNPITPHQRQHQESPTAEAALEKLASEKPLPEIGKLLKSVMEAGPLLQTLLLAGPLPQWQHPPPQLDSIEIPPVSISSSPSPRLLNQDSFNSTNGFKKRGLEINEVSDSSPKYKKVVLHH